MRKAYFIILFSAIILPPNLLEAQSEFEVTKPDLSLNDNGIQIAYQLLNSSISDTFTVRIEVTKADGKYINAQTLAGDVGEHIPGGSNKMILWDIEADGIFLNEEIFVQVYAVPEVPTVAEVIPQPVDETEQNVTDTARIVELIPEDFNSDPLLIEETNVIEEPASGSEGERFNRTGIIIQSMLLPGLGLSRVNSGQPHWIRGVVGYGCIAGTLYFNNKAVESNNDYLASNSPGDRDILFDQAKRQDVISEVLAFTAIGIWVTDLVWTIAGTSDLNMNKSSASHKGISIGTSIEPVSSVPILALRYTF